MGRCRLGGRQRGEGWDEACGRRSSWGHEPWSSCACASVSCMNPQLHRNSSVMSGRSSSLRLTSTSLKFALLSAFVGPHAQGRDGLDHPYSLWSWSGSDSNQQVQPEWVHFLISLPVLPGLCYSGFGENDYMSSQSLQWLFITSIINDKNISSFIY